MKEINGKIREEVVELLKRNSVTDELLCKPGIVELCIKEYLQGHSFIEFNGKRLIFGNYTFNTNSISYSYDSEVKSGNNYTNTSGDVVLNEYGIPIESHEYSETHGWMSDGVSSEVGLFRKNGKIIIKRLFER